MTNREEATDWYTITSEEYTDWYYTSATQHVRGDQ